MNVDVETEGSGPPVKDRNCFIYLQRVDPKAGEEGGVAPPRRLHHEKPGCSRCCSFMLPSRSSCGITVDAASGTEKVGNQTSVMTPGFALLPMCSPPSFAKTQESGI